MKKIKRTLVAVLTLVCITACEKTETLTASNDSTAETTEITVTLQAETTKATTSTTTVTTEITTELTAETEPTDITDEIISAPDYKTAYKKVIEDNSFDEDEDNTYNLIYVNNDDIPELSVRVTCGISLYTYSDGEIYTLMDNWPLGAMGRNGYDYLPECNSVYYEDGDFAGAVRYHTYMSLDENFEFYVTDQYESHLFNDSNGNGVPDSYDEILDTPLYYIDDKEVTEQEIAEKKKGEYKSITGDMSLDELYSMLE